MQKVKYIAIMSAIVLVTAGGYFLLHKEQNGGRNTFAFEPTATPDPGLMSGYKRYTNEDYGFSFQYPEDFTVNAFGAEKEGNMILVQGKGENGFQIYITDFDEDIPVITAARVHKDLPSLAIEQPQEAVLGADLHALIFWSQNPEIGKTREVWIVHEGAVYQITAPAAFDTKLAKIVGTWKFE